MMVVFARALACLFGVRAMRCMACGAEMRLMSAVPDETLMVPGYEHHTLQCMGCNDIERRLRRRESILECFIPPQAWPDVCRPICRRRMMGTILLVILVLMLLGAVPTWPHSRNWGYGPSGGLGLVVIILLILVLTGRF